MNLSTWTFYACIVAISLCQISCSKERDMPTCIREEIDASKPIGEIELVRVERFLFQGDEVYVFNYEGGADFQTPILDGDCNNVCSLGGIAGISECRGEEFYANAKLEEVVWEK